jgi:streptomycin 6-kinase
VHRLRDAAGVNDAWRERLQLRFGPGVLAWVAALPDRQDQLARQWGLVLGEPYPDGATSRVLACRRGDGTQAVLKLSPDPGIVAAEAGALTLWEGTGVTPALLARAPDALLLEQITPGTRLRDEPGPPTPAQVAALVGPLHRAVPAGRFPPLRERLTFLFGLAARRGADPGLVERGLAACLALDGDSDATTLLHGDLHSGNVLRRGRGGLVAIDPRPCVGDPAFDLVDWVLEGEMAPPEQAQRIAAATGLDAQRLLAWARATAVLSGLGGP